MHDTLIRFETLDGVCVATVPSDVDLANASVLERYLTEAAAHASGFIVSLAECGYLDGSGVRALAHVAERFGEDFAIVTAPNTQARRAFENVAFSERVRLYASVSEALFALRCKVPA